MNRSFKEDEKVEMICFEITNDTLLYAQGVGALTIWGIISVAIFKWNLSKYIVSFINLIKRNYL